MTTKPQRTTSLVRYWPGACLVLTLYALVAALLLAHRDFSDQGPLSRHRPALTSPLAGGVSLGTVREECFPEQGTVSKIVGGEVDGHLYYACYRISGEYGSSVPADVLDLRGHRVGDADVIKHGGAWPWVGTVTSSRDFLIDGLLALAVLILLWAWHRLRRQKGDGWRTGVLVTVGIALAGLGLWGWANLMMILLHPDSWGLTVAVLFGAAFGYGVLVGRVLVARRALLSWPRLDARLRDLSLALVGCVALFAALVVALVIASAFGHLPVTTTLWHGLVVLSAVGAMLAAVGVGARWRAARRDAALAGRAMPSRAAVAAVTTGTAVGALTLFALAYAAVGV